MKDLVIFDTKTKQMVIIERNLDSYNYKDFNSMLSLVQKVIVGLKKVFDPSWSPQKPNTKTDKTIDEEMDDPNYEPKNAVVKTR